MRHIRALALSLSFALLALPAYAWPPTWGAELTLTNQKLIAADYGPDRDETKSPENYAAQLDLLAHIRRLCLAEKCLIASKTDKYGNEAFTVNFPDGWWFRVTLDPGVIEIQTRETTLTELKNLEGRIQKFIFDAGASVGLQPHEAIGGGHIHIGDESTFGGDDRLFRNFLVDMINHPEAVIGIFGDRTGIANAFPFTSLPEILFGKLTALIEKFDAGKIQGRHALVEAINNKVYVAMPFPYPKTLRMEPMKNRAVNLMRMDLRFKDVIATIARTLELRGRRPQKNAKDFIAQVELLDARLHVLKVQSHNLAIEPPKGVPENKINADDVARFQRYVGESRLDFKDYKHYVPTEMVSHGVTFQPGKIREATVNPYEKKPGFFSRLFSWPARNRIDVRKCEALFAP